MFSLKPVSGIVDSATGLVSGARKAIDGKVIIRKQRSARVFPFSQIVPYSPELSEKQQKIQTLHENREPVVIYFVDESRPSSVFITPSLIVIFEAQKYSEIIISNIKSIQTVKDDSICYCMISLFMSLLQIFLDFLHCILQFL